MISKKDFKKISDWLWEIPKSFRQDMRVPVRIYASEKLLEEIEPDAVGQVINVASLPGIIKYSLAMPDIHTGYGFVIGGVAAMRLPDGVISPGGVGYDINCLSHQERLLLPLGYYLPIKNLKKKWQQEKLQCFNFKENKRETTNAILFLKRRPKDDVYKLITKGGDEITATKDHPFYTSKGMLSLERLSKGDKVAIYPFGGVPYEKPSNKVIISEDDIKKTLSKLGRKPGTPKFDRVLQKLKKRDFLPLTYKHPRLPYLLKIMGFVFGDASMNFIGKRGDGVFHFAGKREDLEEARKDLEELGYTPSPVHFRKRKTRTGKSVDSYSFLVNASSLVVFLEALGVPRGSKVNQPFRIPRWIFKAPLWQKRLFLASLFGSELRCPHRRLDRRGNFNAPSFPIGKRIELLGNAKSYLNDIKKLLKEFEVKTLYIEQPRNKKHINTKGDASWGLNSVISPTLENLLNLWGKIGFEYNNERKFFANVATQYLKIKQGVLKEKEEAIKVTIPQLLKLGLSGVQIRQQLVGNPLTKRFIESTSWKIKNGIRKIAPRIPTSFPLFQDYLKQVTEGLGKSGMVWDEIIAIKKIPYRDWVYDFTVNHPDHNFIANNFVVSNCGMKLLRSDYLEKDVKPHLEALATEIQKEVPSGLGRGRQLKLDVSSINKILEEGAQRLVEQGYGEKEDLENCESQGKLPQADAFTVSDHAKNRGRDQVGTLGSGNHFLEIQKVDEIFDEGVAKIFGLFKDQIVIMIHTGSRGLGHQIATDYIRLMMRAMDKYGIRLPDRELAACPINSSEGQKYFSAMACGANYAWANRQMIAHFVRKAWKAILGEKASPLVPLYDVAHNIAKVEKHIIGGEETEVVLHRKGATRAFPPGHPEIPKKYQEAGQPVLIPGSMGTASYVLVGTKEGKEAWFSTCHGAGRTMSRHEAMRRVSGQEVVNRLESKGIIVKCWSFRGIAEEAPMAYKDVDNVVEIVHNAGLSKKVARLIPLAVIKGE